MTGYYDISPNNKAKHNCVDILWYILCTYHIIACSARPSSTPAMSNSHYVLIRSWYPKQVICWWNHAIRCTYKVSIWCSFGISLAKITRQPETCRMLRLKEIIQQTPTRFAMLCFVVGGSGWVPVLHKLTRAPWSLGKSCPIAVMMIWGSWSGPNYIKEHRRTSLVYNSGNVLHNVKCFFARYVWKWILPFHHRAIVCVDD